MWCRCQRKSQRTPERITTGGLLKLPFDPVHHQGVRAGRVGHGSLAVDAVEPEEGEYLDASLQLGAAHAAAPGVHGNTFVLSRLAIDARVEVLAEEVEQAWDLIFGMREEVLVEGQLDLPRPELPQGHVVLD